LDSKNKENGAIELLAQNEEAIGRLYSAYAVKFPDFKNLWLGLADEENTHASWIRGLRKKAAEGALVLKTDRFKSAAILTFLKHTESEIAAVSGGLQIINALSVAYYIEQSLIERKYFEAFETDSAILKRLLSDLEAATMRHSQLLKAALDAKRLQTGRK
jgi:rubrerythrin